MNLQATIHVPTFYRADGQWNSHRRRCRSLLCWMDQIASVTVGGFIQEHVARGIGTAAQARAFLQHDARNRGLIIEGHSVRQRTIAQVPTTPLSFDLDSFTFGVEIECHLPRGMSRSEAARLVSEAGVRCEEQRYNHTPQSCWKVVTDGSLGNYETGAEFVSPVLLGQSGMESVEKVCRALTAMGAKVNRKCGFHVHVGVEGRSVPFFYELLRLYSFNESLIDSMVPASRRGSANEYAQPVRRCALTADLDSFLREAGRSRYRKLNVASYWRHRTVEFRQHAGTVEADKASFWIKFCLRMCLRAAQGQVQGAAANLTDLLAQIGCNGDEHAFLVGRADHFARREGRSVPQQIAA